MRIGSLLSLVCLAAALSACGPTSAPSATDGGTQSNGTDAGSNNNTNNQGGGGDGDRLPCSSTNKCPSGQFCFNGICALGCTSNDNCADDQYCDTADLGPPYFCKNKTVPACPSTPCAEGQTCRNGLCSATEVVSTQCTPTPSGNDGCDKYAVCLDDDEEGPQPAACFSFPPCPEDGMCPAGTTGAVCNDGHLPNKGRFCMTGLCSTSLNCPTDWKCVKQASNQPLGFCSSAGPNAMCFQNSDCLSMMCVLPGGPGFPGFCQ